ncbi:MAG: S-layer homology domain-containing protein [Sedimentibacter sp.]|uniref:S-layer homology domain-containing protein n=1 Tax=Sedimentibacter sp. TaxID=1960295 RepID=UPI00315817A1
MKEIKRVLLCILILLIATDISPVYGFGDSILDLASLEINETSSLSNYKAINISDYLTNYGTISDIGQINVSGNIINGGTITGSGIIAAGGTITLKDNSVLSADSISAHYILIDKDAENVYISLSYVNTDTVLAGTTTGTSIIIEGGRTKDLELTLINYSVKSGSMPGLDVQDTGSTNKTIKFGGSCVFASTYGAGIHVPEGTAITLDRASGYNDDESRLTVIGGGFSAGIGSGISETSGNVTINGGTITTTGDNFSSGIGGGYYGSGGVTTINNGIITAKGSVYGAGIGGGWAGAGGTININNGTVTAVAGYGGAGIGGGMAGYDNYSGQGDGGTININGGNITATTNASFGGGAAIGGGQSGSSGTINISGGIINASSCLGAAIGSGYEGFDDNMDGYVNITGGVVDAMGGAGIGGSSNSNHITVNIDDGTIVATGISGFAGIGGFNTTINISGGNVKAAGGVYAAAIGGNQGQPSGTINISGGIVTADGGVQASGIGGGSEGQGQNITISGGTITAISTFGGAAIGGGIDADNGTIIINDGTITAKSSIRGAGIGGGNHGDGGTIIIRGGNVTSLCTDSFTGGAGIGGGYNGFGGTIRIEGGILSASGGFGSAGIGGGYFADGGDFSITDGIVQANGGASGAGIGGGYNGDGGTININGGRTFAKGGFNSAGIGGGAFGAGGSVTVKNSPIINAIGMVDQGAENIGRGSVLWFDDSLDSGTLKDETGSNLSYLLFRISDESGAILGDASLTLSGYDEVYKTNPDYYLWKFVPYEELKTYDYTIEKPGYAAVKGDFTLSSVSHDVAETMYFDMTAPAFSVSPVTKRSAYLNSDDFGLYGTFYIVPKSDTTYTDIAALECTAEVTALPIEHPETKVFWDATGKSYGNYQVYMSDSAENLSLPLDLTLPFDVGGGTQNNVKITTGNENTVVATDITTLYKNSGTAEVIVDNISLTKAFDKTSADVNGIKTVRILIDNVQNAERYEITLPSGIFSPGSNNRIEIVTGYGSVSIPCSIFESVLKSDSVTIGIGKSDSDSLPQNVKDRLDKHTMVEIYVKIDGEKVPWKNNGAPVKVTVPYSPSSTEHNAEFLSVLYVDENGKMETISNGRFNELTGCVVFKTTHFSIFAVDYVEKEFKDLTDYGWAKNQIQVLASKLIISGTTENEFSPSAKITRADFMLLLMNTLELNVDFEDNFDDVEEGSYYFEAAGSAKALGIAAGNGNNRFYPAEFITRQDMMVLTARALEKHKGLSLSNEYSVLEKFNDRDKISMYAAISISSLINEELIAGSDNELNPLGSTTRAEAAVFLYRIFNKFQ